MPDRREGAKGSMPLSTYWEEVAGHANPESTSTLKLEASKDGQSIRLVEITTAPVLAKREVEEEIHEISVLSLVELIRKHGKRLK